MTPDRFWHWVGGRRFSLTVGAGIVHTILLWFGKISESTFKELTVATVAVYIAANTTQKWREKGAQTTQPVGDPDTARGAG